MNGQTHSTGKRVLISGASIAGPALAHWLEQYGWLPTMIERAPQLRTGGQNIDIRGAARTVVRRMGLQEAVRAAGTGEQGTQFVGTDGEIKAAFPAGTSDTDGATAELEILRGELARLLHEKTTDSVETIFGDQITSIHDHDGAARVGFQHGRDQEFDLVVIAEGMNSRSRRLVFGDEAEVLPLGMYTAYLSIPRDAGDNDWARWYNATNGRTVTLRPDNVGTTRATLSFLSGPEGYESLDTADQIEVLKDTFHRVGWQAERILDQLDKSDDMYFEYIGQVKSPAWSRGRVTLLGDAGYCASPISGMGTSLALVGAYVLAGELAAHTHYRDGLARYEEIMRPYVDQAQKLPPGAPRIANPKTATGIALFNLALKVASAKPLGMLGNKLFSPPAEKMELPDYTHLMA